MEIYIIRHTRVNIAKDTCYGQSELALADTFEAEAQAYQKALPKNFDAVYSSPLKRCMQLAKRLGYGDVTAVDDLMEMNFGHLEGKNGMPSINKN